MSIFKRKQKAVVNPTRPVTKEDMMPRSLGKVEKKEIILLQEIQHCLAGLSNDVYGLGEPTEIAQRVLREACNFYDADWCGVFDGDMMLKLWMPMWWYNRKTGDMTKPRIDEGGISGEFPRWLEAIENNCHVVIADVETIKEESPDEYTLMTEQMVRSVLAVPYHKRERGFLLLRNPKRYADRPELLRIMANIIVQEINEQKILDRMKLDSCPACVNDSSDIVINLFGGLTVCGERGKLCEADIKSPFCAKMLVLLLMNRKRGMSAREISNALWPNKDYDNPTGNLRSLLFRCRSMLRLITNADLIITTPNGYRINHDLKIKTDFEEFEKIYTNRKYLIDRASKITELGKAVKLYQGKLFPIGCSEHWFMPHHSRYSIMYLPVLDELMELLHSGKEYQLMYEYATLAISVEPDSPIVLYWLIISLRKHGAADMARQHLESAKLRLLEEEYRELEERLISD